MKSLYSFRTALIGLKTNRTRSFLTILGIVIGITAIMMVMSLGAGAQNLILGQISSLGSNLVFVLPGKEVSGAGMPMDALYSDALKNKDLEQIQKKSNVPHLKSAMPIVFSSEVVTRGSDSYRYTIYGVTELMKDLYQIEMQSGDFITASDVSSLNNSAVIGKRVAEKLFPDNNAVGEKIRVKDRSFRVAGVMKEKGQGSMANFDDAIIIPYNVLQRDLMGIKYFQRLVVEVDNEKNIDATVRDVRDTIRDSHNITDPDKDDFHVNTSADIAKAAGTVLGTLTIFLAAVAAISLLVGGVGIMNIVLVSVTERTREIGLRKALGATSNEILMQFLIESMLLTSSGGIVGITLGTLLSFAAATIITKVAGLNWPFSFPWQAALLGFAVSAGIGLVFGLYPAKKAADLSPIEALRYE